MKKMLSVFLVLSFGFNLTANDNLINSKREAIPSIALPSHIENNSRTEEWILYMVDSWGDGWNGASLDLSINGAVVLDDATIASGSEAIEYFNVEDGDYIETLSANICANDGLEWSSRTKGLSNVIFISSFATW